METISETQDDSSGANPSSVKSEDGSPSQDGDRGSPPPNCAICLGRCRNKSFTDSCLHQFCFKCLVTWSKVKTECPLCKQNFKSIIHNVQSNQQYEEYRVEQRRHEEERIDFDDLVTATRRFRYRTTLTIPRGGEHLALQRLLMHYPPLSAMVGMSRDLPALTPTPLPASRRRRSPSSFRRTVYRHNLWARPLPDFTGRHRDCTPEFYRYNDSQMHRLVPWLNRELHYLLLENAGHIAYVLQRILELLPRYHISSPEFREEMCRYFGARTDHFLHELHCFAATPYDLTGYDRNVQYTTDSRISNTVNDVLSSSDTESGDSDIVLVTADSPYDTFRPVTPLLPSQYEGAGPSARRLPDPVYPQNQITTPIESARLGRTVIPIETISHSDTDDDEVMVTGYIKPPNQRTPEVVDLRDSDDSDVVVTEGPAPAPAPASTRDPRGFVKLTLSRPRSVPSDSEENDETYTPPPAQRRRLLSGSTHSPRSSPSPSRSTSPRVPSPPATTSEDGDVDRLTREMDGLSPSEVRSSHVGRGNKRRRTRRSRDADREEPASTSTAVPTPTPTIADLETDRRDIRRKKSKSSNGKGVKSSSRRDNVTNTDTSKTSNAESSRTTTSDCVSTTTSESSRTTNSESTRTTESSRIETSVREEPQPGPSSRSRVRVKSRREERTTESTEESRPGPNKSERPGRSSRKDDSAAESRRAESAMDVQEEPQPSWSRTAVKGKSRKDDTESRRSDSTEARPSTSRAGSGVVSGSIKKKNTEEVPPRRNSRENKRLKSVVKKTSNWNSAGPSSSSTGRPSSSNRPPTGMRASIPVPSTSVSSSKSLKRRRPSDTNVRGSSPDFFTDSDDDIPLNLTIQRSGGQL